MTKSKLSSSLRSLPRVFITGASSDSTIEIPEAELQKLRKVLRLSTGDEIAVLPNDGSLLRCVLEGRRARALEVSFPDTEPSIRLTVGQALPKGDKVEEIVRACTEIGTARFLLFASDRTVVSWDEKKVVDRLRRLHTIAREACEMSFRTRLPVIEWVASLEVVLKSERSVIVLSENERVTAKLPPTALDTTLVAGPEGGWSREELLMIGDRGVTLGPRVLRVDHAAAAAAAILLLDHE